MSDYVTAGEIFTGSVPGKSVTPTRLNHHVTGLRILPAFMDSATHNAPAALTDVVLCADAAFSAFNMPTLAQLFAAQVADAAAAVASLRTLGNTGNKAAPGATTPGLTFDNSFTGRQSIAHINGQIGASQPTCVVNAVNATGAGINATAALSTNSSDLAGIVTLHIDGAGTPGATVEMFTLTFHLAFVTNAPTVFIVPLNPAAVALQQGTKSMGVYSAPTTSTVTTALFKLISGTVAPTAGNYIFGYFCIG